MLHKMLSSSATEFYQDWVSLLCEHAHTCVSEDGVNIKVEH